MNTKNMMLVLSLGLVSVGNVLAMNRSSVISSMAGEEKLVTEISASFRQDPVVIREVAESMQRDETMQNDRARIFLQLLEEYCRAGAPAIDKVMETLLKKEAAQLKLMKAHAEVRMALVKGLPAKIKEETTREALRRAQEQNEALQALGSRSSRR